MRKHATNVTPEWTISLRWDEQTKVWRLMVQDKAGNVVAREAADTTVYVDRYVAADLLREVRRSLEMLLPF